MSVEQTQSLEKNIWLKSATDRFKISSVNDLEIRNYQFETLNGKTDLSSLLADKKLLLVIHNMGQACRYCTLWADGFNGIDTISVN